MNQVQEVSVIRSIPVIQFLENIILQIIILLAAFSLIACPTDDNEKKEPAVETIIPGQWSGESGFGEIIFTVDSKVAGIASLEIIFMDYQCGQVTHNGSIKTTYSTHVLFELPRT